MKKYNKLLIIYLVVLIIGTFALATNTEKPVPMHIAFLQSIPASAVLVGFGILINKNWDKIIHVFKGGKKVTKQVSDNYKQYKTTDEYKEKKEIQKQKLNEFEAKQKVKKQIKYQNSKKGKAEAIKSLKADAEAKGLAYCPKCGSASVTTTNKKISLTKGAVGAAVGSIINPVGTAIGAGAGAISSKKMYCVCMKCGHRWKL